MKSVFFFILLLAFLVGNVRAGIVRLGIVLEPHDPIQNNWLVEVRISAVIIKKENSLIIGNFWIGVFFPFSISIETYA